MKRFVVMVTVAGAAIVPAAASAHVSAQPSQAQSANKATLLERVTVKASEFKFVLSKKTARRGVVVFKITNVGTIKHDFDIKGRKTRLLSHGQSTTLRVTFLRKGHYPYKCTVPGHAAAGMKGVFTIS